MPSQREIRRRIGSARNIKQITRAMQFVAASKLRRAQESTLAARPYREKLDDIATSRVKDFEIGLYRFLETERPQILKDLAAQKTLTDEISSALNQAIDEYRKSFLA